jgi:hypothetical protein
MQLYRDTASEAAEVAADGADDDWMAARQQQAHFLHSLLASSAAHRDVWRGVLCTLSILCVDNL